MSKQQHETKPTIRKKVLTIMKNKVNDLFAYFLFLLMSLGFIMVSCSTMKNVALSIDAGVYLNVAKNFLNGKVLYTQIVDNKGPVLYFMNALALKLGGQCGVAILEFIIILIILLYAYKIVKLLDKNIFHQLFIPIIVASFFLRFFTYGLSCEEYALAFSMMGLYECVKYYKNDKFSIYQCYSLGILGGLCFFIRQNLIVVFAGFGIGIFIKHIIEKRYKELIKYIIFSILGFITVALPILGYLLINNAFNDYIYCAFTLNMNANRQGIIISLIDIFFLTPATSSLLIIYFVILIRRIIQNKEIENISICLTIILTIIFNSIGLLVSDHYFISFIPIYLFMLSYFLLTYDNNIVKKAKKTIVYLLLLIIAITNMVLSFKNIYLPEYNMFIGEYINNFNNSIVDIINNNTNEDDQIAMIAFADQFYYLAKKDSVSRHTYLLCNYAFGKDDQIKIVKEYFDDIINKKPKIILMDYNTMVVGVLEYIVPEGFDTMIEENYVVIHNTIVDSLDENGPEAKGITIFKLKDN